MNPVPVIVTVVTPEPAVTEDGEMFEIVGTGLSLLDGGFDGGGVDEEPPPPQLLREIRRRTKKGTKRRTGTRIQ